MALPRLTHGKRRIRDQNRDSHGADTRARRRSPSSGCGSRALGPLVYTRGSDRTRQCHSGREALRGLDPEAASRRAGSCPRLLPSRPSPCDTTRRFRHGPGAVRVQPARLGMLFAGDRGVGYGSHCGRWKDNPKETEA